MELFPELSKEDNYIWCCQNNHIETIKMIYAHDPPPINVREKGFEIVCLKNNLIMSQYISSMEPSPFHPNLIRTILIQLVQLNHLEIINWLFNLYHMDHHLIKGLFRLACLNDKLHVIQFLEKYLPSYNDPELMVEMSGTPHLEIIKYLTSTHFKKLDVITVLRSYWHAEEKNQVQVKKWILLHHTQLEK
jgi:hypothetical protein